MGIKKIIKKSASKGFPFVLKTFVIIACLLVAGAFLTLGGNVIVRDGQLNVTSDFFVGTDVLFVDSAGNKVGIGTRSPNEKLTVVGNVNITENIIIGDKLTFAFSEFIDNLVDGWLRVTGSLNITEDLNVIGNITGSSPVKIKGGLNVLNASGTSQLYVNDTTGNVGIGTTSPGTAKLKISGGVLDMSSQKIINLSTPTADTDAATKGYMDTEVDSLTLSCTTETCSLAGGPVACTITCSSGIATGCNIASATTAINYAYPLGNGCHCNTGGTSGNCYARCCNVSI